MTSTPCGIGISSLSVAFPLDVRGNEFFSSPSPPALERSQPDALSRILSPDDGDALTRIFDEEMQPFLADPFRGTRRRRALASGESSISLGCQALRDALSARDLAPNDLDLLISVAFLPEHGFPGDAAFIARDMGLGCPTLNLESTCTGTMMALQVATSLIGQGVYRRIGIVVACTYSRNLDLEDTLSWFLGDGVGALVVDRLAGDCGVIGFSTVSTSETCGAFEYAPVPGRGGITSCVVRPGTNNPSRALRATAAPNMRRCVSDVLARAGQTIDDVDFLVTNTPSAWFHRFAARVLEVDLARTISTYRAYANIGPALTVANLFHAAAQGKLRPGDNVLIYAFGTVSNASAALVRWGDVTLGPRSSAAPDDEVDVYESDN